VERCSRGDLDAYRHVASACVEHVVVEYARLYERALLLGYTAVYLSDMATRLEGQGYDVSGIREIVGTLGDEDAEDLDCFWDTKVGAAVCDILGMDAGYVRRSVRQRAISLVDVGKVRREAMLHAMEICRECTPGLAPMQSRQRCPAVRP